MELHAIEALSRSQQQVRTIATRAYRGEACGGGYGMQVLDIRLNRCYL